MLLATLAHGAMAYRGGRFDPVTVPGELPSFVISIAEAANGELWLGSRDAGIFRVRGAQVSRLVDGLPDLKVNCLLATPAGDVWIGTDRGVARWNGTEITQTGVPAALRGTPALGLTRDRDANLWVAAGARGLLRVGPDGAVHAASEAGWSLGHVAATFEDRDGNLWVGPIAASNAGVIPCSRRIRARRACHPMPAVPFMRPPTDGSGSARRAAACSGSATARSTR